MVVIFFWRTIGLLDRIFFELSDYRLSDRRIRKTIGLLDIELKSQTIGLLDIGF